MIPSLASWTCRSFHTILVVARLSCTSVQSLFAPTCGLLDFAYTFLRASKLQEFAVLLTDQLFIQTVATTMLSSSATPRPAA